MNQLKITIALIIAILLQWTLRNVAEPLAYVDFPLIIVVYAALQRDAIKAILFGTFAGNSALFLQHFQEGIFRVHESLIDWSNARHVYTSHVGPNHRTE